jgi:hypothetical protein
MGQRHVDGIRLLLRRLFSVLSAAFRQLSQLAQQAYRRNPFNPLNLRSNFAAYEQARVYLAYA